MEAKERKGKDDTNPRAHTHTRRAKTALADSIHAIAHSYRSIGIALYWNIWMEMRWYRAYLLLLLFHKWTHTHTRAQMHKTMFDSAFYTAGRLRCFFFAPLNSNISSHSRVHVPTIPYLLKGHKMCCISPRWQICQRKPRKLYMPLAIFRPECRMIEAIVSEMSFGGVASCLAMWPSHGMALFGKVSQNINRHTIQNTEKEAFHSIESGRAMQHPVVLRPLNRYLSR